MNVYDMFWSGDLRTMNGVGGGFELLSSFYCIVETEKRFNLNVRHQIKIPNACRIFLSRRLIINYFNF